MLLGQSPFLQYFMKKSMVARRYLEVMDAPQMKVFYQLIIFCVWCFFGAWELACAWFYSHAQGKKDYNSRTCMSAQAHFAFACHTTFFDAMESKATKVWGFLFWKTFYESEMYLEFQYRQVEQFSSCVMQNLRFWVKFYIRGVSDSHIYNRDMLQIIVHISKEKIRSLD